DNAASESGETIDLALGTPTGASLGTPSSATLTIQEDSGDSTSTTTTPTVEFASTNYTVNETSGSATVTVQLSAPASQVVEVQYQTSDGTGKAGTDYQSTVGAVTFPVGQVSQSFTVPILDDNRVGESSETVNLSLSNPFGASLGTPSSATLTIQEDNDASTPLTVEFASASYTTGETSGSATITVQLNGTPSQSVTVHYQTSDGTGKAGTDYTSVSGTLTFSAGVSSRSFTVPIL